LTAHLRIARPVRELERALRLYRKGLGLVEIGRFADHAGFDGVMLGAPAMDYHLEFTRSRLHAVEPSPSADDLLVFYIADRGEWKAACARMLAAGFTPVQPLNPYWQQRGRTFRDDDGYRTVLEQSAWAPATPGEDR
jgi:catechol 2,3-dioxygenase-like lactoylglutathione lyase family enzyme